MRSLLRTTLLTLAAAWITIAPLAAQQRGRSGASDSTVAALGANATPRPGDRIALRIWNEPEISDTFNILETGEVILPKLGTVGVVDQPIGALQDSLRRAYAVYLRNPSVEVTVLRRIAVQGEVRRPGLYLVDLTMGLRDLIAEAGGITDAGDPEKIMVVRGEERIRFEKGRGPWLLVTDLRSGDQVVVGQRSWLQRNVFAVTGTTLAVVGFVIPIIRGLLTPDEPKPDPRY